MSDTILDRIQKYIYQYWEESDSWPDYIEVMRLILFESLYGGEKRGDKPPNRLALLPGKCCHAVGGDPQWADELAAAWLLFYTAAHLMDKIEDQDQGDSYWEELGPGVVLNVASGYYFTASLIINHFYRQQFMRESVNEIVDDFYNHFLLMCSGQHRDLIHPEPNLAQYWETTGAKSGVFFKLACRSGARLVTADATKLEAFSKFGYHLGILVQMLDDLEDIEGLKNAQEARMSPGIERSLPVAYALENLPKDAATQLRRYLHEGKDSSENVFDLIDQSGAGFYLSLEIERHREAAIRALQQADPIQPAGKELISLLPDF